MRRFLLTSLIALSLARPALANYYTNGFTATENPLSDGGIWRNGAADGTSWHNVRTTPGLAFGTQVETGSGYDDSIAVLTGAWNSNQSAQAAIKIVNSDSAAHEEMELLLRFAISNNVARGYEINFSVKGQYLQIIRWNGAAGSFLQLNVGNQSPPFSLTNGTICTATVSNTTIYTYCAGIAGPTATDTVWSNGWPGLGLYIDNGSIGNNANFGWANFIAWDTDPYITTQPADQTVTAGATAAFTVAAAGKTALSYQWSRAGTNVTGATQSSYTTPATKTGDEGQVFYCTVTDTGGTIQSSNAVLHVNSSGTGFTTNDAAKTVTTDGTQYGTTNALAYVASKTQDGWTVIVGDAGSTYTWHYPVIVNSIYTLTIQGAATNNRPTITFGSGTWAVGISIVAGTNKVVTVKDFIFTDATGGPTTSLLSVDGSGLVFRYNNLLFTNVTVANGVGTVGSLNTTPNSGPWGLIDHCEFGSSGNSFYGFYCRDNGWGAGWGRPMTWGTSNAVYIEDCSFHAVTTVAGRPFVDGSSSCRIAVRHCNITNYTTVVHGPDSPGITNGCLQFELYNNTFYTDQYVSGQDYCSYFRGGTAAIYSNTVTQLGGHGAILNCAWKFSVDCASSAWSSEGCPRQYTYPADYPVYQQVGQGDLAGAPGAVPIYVWSNTVPGTVLGDVKGGIDAGDAPFIASGRDYYTNQPMPGYAAYVYPHPLTGNSPDPYISTQPQNQSVTAPATATFSVTASGLTALSYQWNRAGTNVTGATQSSYTTPPTATGDNGQAVYVTVTDTAGSLQSATATLYVSSGAAPPASGNSIRGGSGVMGGNGRF